MILFSICVQWEEIKRLYPSLFTSISVTLTLKMGQRVCVDSNKREVRVAFNFLWFFHLYLCVCVWRHVLKHPAYKSNVLQSDPLTGECMCHPGRVTGGEGVSERTRLSGLILWTALPFTPSCLSLPVSPPPHFLCCMSLGSSPRTGVPFFPPPVSRYDVEEKATDQQDFRLTQGPYSSVSPHRHRRVCSFNDVSITGKGICLGSERMQIAKLQCLFGSSYYCITITQ